MDGAREALEWVSESRRLLLGPHVQPPLMAPVSRHHSRTNFSLRTAIVVFMVFGVGALFCCCYRWEWRLRVQSQTGAQQSEGGAGAAQAARSDDQGVQGQDTKPASTKFSGQVKFLGPSNPVIPSSTSASLVVGTCTDENAEFDAMQVVNGTEEVSQVQELAEGINLRTVASGTCCISTGKTFICKMLLQFVKPHDVPFLVF